MNKHPAAAGAAAVAPPQKKRKRAERAHADGRGPGLPRAPSPGSSSSSTSSSPARATLLVPTMPTGSPAENLAVLWAHAKRFLEKGGNEHLEIEVFDTTVTHFQDDSKEDSACGGRLRRVPGSTPEQQAAFPASIPMSRATVVATPVTSRTKRRRGFRFSARGDTLNSQLYRYFDRKRETPDAPDLRLLMNQTHHEMQRLGSVYAWEVPASIASIRSMKFAWIFHCLDMNRFHYQDLLTEFAIHCGGNVQLDTDLPGGTPVTVEELPTTALKQCFLSAVQENYPESSIFHLDDKGQRTAKLNLQKKYLLGKGFDVTEQWLFHGSGAYRDIIDGGYQNAGTANGKAFGAGVYFASQIDYSLQPMFSPMDASGYRCVLVNRVIVGSRETTHGRTTMLRPGYRSGGDQSGTIVMKPFANLEDVAVLYAFVFKDRGLNPQAQAGK
jgi:hypothetical protein